MKLVRFGEPGAEKPGVWLDDMSGRGEASILDVRGMAFDIGDYDEHFFERAGLERLAGLLNEPELKTIPAKGVRLGPPVVRPSKIVCVGGNYAEHFSEVDKKIPDSPVFFNKATTAVIGPYDDIILPKSARVVDAEAELAVVIGRRTKNIGQDRALECVAGYVALNDVSDRDAQHAGGQWFRGKSPDTFCPLGPCMVTSDAIDDPHNLSIAQRLNGEVLQESNTSMMVFKLSFIISFLSATITLLPGDIVSTGTPGGVGSARRPPVLLKSGDIVEIVVEKVGGQRNRVI